MAAVRRADRPGRADVPGLGLLGVVPALAVRHADRVDRRQVDDVEPELGELRQHLRNAGEAAERAREELVPRAEAGQRAVDVDLERLRLDLGEAVAGGCGEPLLDRQLLAAEQDRALGELAGQVGLAARHLPAQLVLPGRDPIGPGDHGERPEPGLVDRERAAEAVVAERDERLLARPPGAGTRHPDRGAERVVAVLEDGRGRRRRGHRRPRGSGSGRSRRPARQPGSGCGRAVGLFSGVALCVRFCVTSS